MVTSQTRVLYRNEVQCSQRLMVTAMATIINGPVWTGGFIPSIQILILHYPLVTNIPFASTDIEHSVEYIRTIRRRVNKKLDKIPKMAEDMDTTELEDTSRVLFLLECMLDKYREKRDLYAIMSEVGNLMRETSLGIDILDGEVDELLSQSKLSCNQIQNTRLMTHAQSNAADRLQVQSILEQTSVCDRVDDICVTTLGGGRA